MARPGAGKFRHPPPGDLLAHDGIPGPMGRPRGNEDFSEAMTGAQSKRGTPRRTLPNVRAQARGGLGHFGIPNAYVYVRISI